MMNVQTKPLEDAAAIVAELGRRAKSAAAALRNASTGAKNRALAEAARLIRAESAAILAANAKAFLQLITREGRIAPDWDDEIVQGAAVARDGRIVAERLGGSA